MVGGSSLLPDRVPFEGRVYNAYLDGSGTLNLVSTLLDGSNLRTDPQPLTAVTRPTLAVNEGGTLLVAYVAKANGDIYQVGKRAGLAYTSPVLIGNDVIDQPQAYGGRTGVGVTVTRSDYRRWTKTTTDGMNFDANWLDNRGKLIPLGTNSVQPNYTQVNDDITLLHPRAQRVRMYLDGPTPEAPIFGVSDLNRLRDNGVRTMIINLNETINDTGRFDRQINSVTLSGGGTILDWARNNPNVMVILELGNEPDRLAAKHPGVSYYNQWETRYRALDIADRFTSAYAVGNKNVEMMISLPTIKDGEGYFNDFTAPNADGRGRVGDKFRHVGVHVYSNGCLLRTENVDNPPHSVMRILDMAKASTNGGVYITESGINTNYFSASYFQTVLVPRYNQTDPANGYANARWAELGRRYVNALAAFDNIDGRVKGVTFFQDARGGDYGPGTPEPYNIDDGNTTGEHAHYAMGNRVTNMFDCIAPDDVRQR